MALSYHPLHPRFAAEVRGIDLRRADDAATLDAIRAGMDEYAVLVFRDQPLSDAEQMAFARRFDGELHAKTGSAVLTRNRFGNEALTDISNLDESGEILEAGRPPAHVRAGQPPVAHGRLVPGPAGPLLDADARVVPPVPRRHRVRRHARRLRRAGRRDAARGSTA